MKAASLALVSCCLFAASVAESQTQHIQKLVISSSWGGLGPSGRSATTFLLSGDHYVQEGRKVPITLFESLESSLREPSLSKPDPANLGISTTWLESHFRAATEQTTYFDYSTGSPAQQSLFHDAFVDQKTIQQRLDRVFGTFHTDDYPSVRCELTFTGGKKLILSTTSQNAYMIPWVVDRDNSKAETYNIAISQALFNILPKKFLNRSRLTDEGQFVMGLLPQLASETASDVKQQWETLGARNRAGDALEILKRDYQIRSAEVNSYHNLDYGTKWEKSSGPHEENLHADLRREEWPKHFYLAAILLHHDQQTDGADDLRKDARKYEDLVFSIPWINEYYKAHPDDYSWLFFVHGRSFTEKAMRIFAADMKEGGHEELISRVTPVQEQAALLEDAMGDYWVILPDKSAILWRVNSLSTVMGWSSSQFPFVRCTDYQTSSGGCSGTLISPKGKIIHP